MSIEAMKLALEALEAGPHADLLMNTGGIIQNLRIAVEQAEKAEPVAWRWLEDGEWQFATSWSDGPPPFAEPLYTHPPAQCEPLSHPNQEITPEPSNGADCASHPDDMAVDRFAEAMKAKLAKQRAKGYGGWDDKAACPTERLQTMLTSHISKGDPVDVGNFAMMLHQRGEPTASHAALTVPAFTGSATRKLTWLQEQGWQINGVHIQRQKGDQWKHGAVTAQGMVLWWHLILDAARRPLP